MLSQAEATETALNYATFRLGITGKSAVAEQDSETGSWKVLIDGEQEEELLMVKVQLNVQVYEDGNGETKCRLLMSPTRSGEGVPQVKQAEFFDSNMQSSHTPVDEVMMAIENNSFPG